MSDLSSKIEVHINLNKGAASKEQLNRAIQRLPAEVTYYGVGESSEPDEPTDFRANGLVTKTQGNSKIPCELYAVGEVIEAIHKNTPCRVQKTTVDSSGMDRTFKLRGHIKQ